MVVLKPLRNTYQNQPLPLQMTHGAPEVNRARGGHLTFIIQEHVLGLEVPVDDGSLVQVLQAADDLGRVEDGAWLPEARVLLIHIVNVVPGGRLCAGLCFSGTTTRVWTAVLLEGKSQENSEGLRILRVSAKCQVFWGPQCPA